MKKIKDSLQVPYIESKALVLKIKRANGRYTEATDQEILLACQPIFKKRLCNGDVLTSPNATKDYLNALYRHSPIEIFSLVLLNNQHRVIDHVEVARGTIDSATVYPRDVVKAVLNANASAVILAHNHPSGSTQISHADKVITQKIKNALSAIDVRVLDHLIVGDSVTSFAEQGIL